MLSWFSWRTLGSEPAPWGSDGMSRHKVQHKWEKWERDGVTYTSWWKRTGDEWVELSRFRVSWEMKLCRVAKRVRVTAGDRVEPW